jgi:glycosyltransferase involved in cell wall biosynthesis
MRILMIAACPLPWPRGTPIRIHRMAEALCERGHAVTVLTYPLGDLAVPVPYRVRRVAPGSTMTAAPGPTLRKLLFLDPLLCREIRRAVRDESFDVVHAHHYEGLLTALAAFGGAARVPVVYDAHTLLASELPQYGSPLLRAVLASLGAVVDRRLPPRAGHVIAVTERMRDWFTRVAGIASDRVTLIGNGVEHEHFVSPTMRPSLSAARSAATVGGAARPGPQIVFAGNLARYQGIELLLQAFGLVRRMRPDAELVFVTGSELAPLRSELKRLSLTDAVRTFDDDYGRLPQRLANADVLVNPRIDCDGLPQKLLNYMASGRPIVSFESSAAVLQQDRTALVVPDGDVDAFAAAVLRLVDDPALGRSLGAAARREVVAAHGWRQVADRVTEVYETVLARPG